jgi:hypothetical protein
VFEFRGGLWTLGELGGLSAKSPGALISITIAIFLSSGFFEVKGRGGEGGFGVAGRLNCRRCEVRRLLKTVVSPEPRCDTDIDQKCSIGIRG